MQLTNVRPTLLNSAMGLITTLVNVYTTQHGSWSITSVATAVVTTITILVAFALYILHLNWIELAWADHCVLNRPDTAS